MTRSLRIKQIVPFPLGAHDLALRAEQAPRDVLGAGTVVDTTPVRNSFRTVGPNVGTSYYEWALLETYVVEAGLSAEDEGYDAVVVDTTTDSGVRTLRSRLSIPVVGAGMTAYAIAMLLGSRFSIVTYTPEHTFLVEDSLRGYDLTGRCASFRNIGVAPVLENATDVAKDDEARRFVEEGRRAMAEDGAQVLLVASTTMHRAAGAMQRELPVPVVDPGPTAIALAELLVSLGLAHSKAAYPSPGALQDELLRALPSANP
jgi:allantoin racemase